MLIVLSVLTLVAWLTLAFGRGRFWHIVSFDTVAAPARGQWPDVAVIVPARNEADVIGRTVASLLGQDYSGRSIFIVVDDHSDDGTAHAANHAATDAGGSERLRVVTARALPAGWTGKLWALSEGVREAERALPTARYVWFSDADIEHDPAFLRRLVGKAEAEDLDLTSLMVELPIRGGAGRLLLPPFVYFFAKLYPFAWVNDAQRSTAAAAGGCVLLRRAALDHAGGLTQIAGALIDDCALAAHIKSKGRDGGGRIWLGLTRAARSTRAYDGMAGIWRMVARSAYTQLDHSPVVLAGTVAGMALTYLAPPLLVLTLPWHGQTVAALIALSAWALMAATFWPTLRYYGQPAAMAPVLPIAACLYCAMTLDSACAHMRGRGGAWKGRVATHLTGPNN